MIPEDVHTTYMSLPNHIKAFTMVLADGSYNICLNSNHSRETLLLAYYHEMKHIDDGDFNKFDVNTIELEAHN